MPLLPFVPFPNCAEVVIRGIMAARPAFVTFGVTKPTPYSASDLHDLNTDINSWWAAQVQGLVGSNFTIVDYKATGLTTSVDPVDVLPCLVACSGSGAGSVEANQVAVVITKHTALRGRSYRGRNYWPAVLSSSLFTGRTLGAVAVAQWNSAYSNLPGFLAAHGGVEVVLSRYNAGVRRTVGVATPIVGYECKGLLGTIRNRVSSA